ncbi:MAG TPA: hypothetical protein DCZ06_01850 [Alphaproteobacteria bacterium]|nr:hypothetical protein [Alphaproteobacteria bacterium]
MKFVRTFICLFIACFLPFASPARAGFAEALSAFDAGDYQTAYDEWLPLANNGDSAAQRNIGHLLRRGLGIPQDLQNAALWYERAAQAGQIGAAVNLAFMYLDGTGVPQDVRKAADWFRLAARQGHALASYNLGVLYDRGWGVVRDPRRAQDLYIQADRLGLTLADTRLARLSMEPPELVIPAQDNPVLSAVETVSADPVMDRWRTSKFQIEALAADPQALRELLLAGRTAYLQGEFLAAAEKWYRAAEAGDPDAQYGLGQLYMRGQGVDQDSKLAYFWLSRAVASGHMEANGVLQELLSAMTPQEIAAAAAAAAAPR